MDRTVNTFTMPDLGASLFDSHCTRLTDPEPHDTWFSDQRAYSRAIMSAWGLPLGEMPYSHDNEVTLRSLVELIGYRQRDLQFRSRVKQEIAGLGIEKQKYRGLMEQSQRSLEEMVKRLGRAENECGQIKARQKRGEVQAKREREEDKKMITMLRAKNEQILHEIKKKEQQVNRVKEQMKRSVGEKVGQARNSFQIFEGLSPKKELKSDDCNKYTFLLERNEREISDLVKENSLLRQKLFEIREQLLDFNEWIDKQLFGEKEVDSFKRHSRFPFNHNLLFKKESLTDELSNLLEVAKDGIKQLRDMFRGEGSLENRKARSSDLLIGRDGKEELNFKKLKRQDSSKTDRVKATESEDILELKQLKSKKSGFIRKEPNSENQTPKAVKKMSNQKIETPKPEIMKNQQKDIIIPKQGKQKKWQESIDVPFEDELLSDVGDNQESSIVSHIEVQKLGKNRFDKWNILYQDDE